MTVQGAIEYADEMKPNAFSNEVKTKWLADLEGRLAASVFLMAPAEFRPKLMYRWPEDKDYELLVDPPYDDLYTLWLQAKIDEANGEYDKYANSMAIYNEHYGSFVRWFAGLYDPAQGYWEEERAYGTV